MVVGSRMVNHNFQGQSILYSSVVYKDLRRSDIILAYLDSPCPVSTRLHWYVVVEKDTIRLQFIARLPRLGGRLALLATAQHPVRHCLSGLRIPSLVNGT